MKTLSSRALLLVLALAVSARADSPATSAPQAPTPGPELRQLAVFVGEWTYETETLATPLGPATTSTGTETSQFTLDGFAVQTAFVDKTTTGESHYHELSWFDPKSGRIGYTYLGNDGFVETGTYAFDQSGNSWAWEGTFLVAGNPWTSRGTGVLGADHASFLQKGEISPDGHTWHAAFTKRATKTPTTPASALPLDAQLIALETGTWQAAKRHDVAAIAAVCLPDCVEIWANGRVVPLQEVLARIPDTEYLEYRLDDFKVTFPSESTGLVHYRAWTRTTYKGKENTPRWKRATAVWVKKDGAWKAACYQESPEPLAPADTAAIEQEVLALEHAWAAAYVNADLKALDRLEAEEWICTTAKGEIYRKADDLREVGDGSFKATAFEMSDLTVQVYGDTVVITGRQTEKATYKGKDASAVYRITDVWLRRDGRWQAIASHLSREAATNPPEK